MPPIETVNRADKENTDMETDFVKVPNFDPHESTVFKNTSIPVFQDRENKGDSFSQILNDIDDDLRINGNSLNQAHAEAIIPHKEISPLFGLGSLGNDLFVSYSVSRTPTLVPPLH